MEDINGVLLVSLDDEARINGENRRDFRLENLVSEMTSFDDIKRVLTWHSPVLLDLPSHTWAAVALVLCAQTYGLEMLFIERAFRADDPWSGDLGFPGGKVKEGEHDPKLTAERETQEEIGIDLRDGHYLGRLSDITGAHMPVMVSCFVYGVPYHPPFVLSHELRDAFWISIADLTSPESHVTASVRFSGEMLERPAIRLPKIGKPVLWGITYRLVMEFLKLFSQAPDRLQLGKSSKR
jgi:8-oxo-dGTP pyrophosphatase MutT (NUDIX family)